MNFPFLDALPPDLPPDVCRYRLIRVASESLPFYFAVWTGNVPFFEVSSILIVTVSEGGLCSSLCRRFFVRTETLTCSDLVHPTLCILREQQNVVGISDSPIPSELCDSAILRRYLTHLLSLFTLLRSLSF